MKLITRTEEHLLLTVWKLQDNAYTRTVQEALSDLNSRTVSIGAVYIPLERLVRQGLLKTREGAPTDKRGGRRKRFYSVTAKGQAALAAVHNVQTRVWREWLASGMKASTNTEGAV